MSCSREDISRTGQGQRTRVTDPATIVRQAAEAGIAVDLGQAGSLARFAALLLRWNARVNLISRKDEERIVPRHLLDSLAASRWLSGQRIADLGTGAGLPGIPLAVANPERHFTLIDRNARRLSFVRQAVAELGLGNVTVLQQDFAHYRPEPLFDTVVSRAVWDPAALIPAVWPLVGARGRAVLLCGQEVAELEGVARLRSVDFALPGLTRRHRVLVIDRDGESEAPSE